MTFLIAVLGIVSMLAGFSLFFVGLESMNDFFKNTTFGVAYVIVGSVLFLAGSSALLGALGVFA